MPSEIDISVSRDESDVHVIVPTEFAESLYGAIRAAKLSATFPDPALFRLVSIRRTRDGRVIRIEESIDSFIEVSDPDDKIESIIEEWLNKQGWYHLKELVGSHE